MIGTDAHDLVRPLRPQEFGAHPPRRTSPTRWSSQRGRVSGSWRRSATAAGPSGSMAKRSTGTSLLLRALRARHERRRGCRRDLRRLPDEADRVRGSRGAHVDARVPDGGRTDVAVPHRRAPQPDRRARETAPGGGRGASLRRDDVVNLVVVDLLWLDGEWLLDVPLLERKRVLESILPPSQLVRASPYVRQPIGTWIGSWRAQGFRGDGVQGRQLPLPTRRDRRRLDSTDMPRR